MPDVRSSEISNQVKKRSMQSPDSMSIRQVSWLIKSAVFLMAATALGSCSQQYTVSVNSQAVFDPNSRLPSNEVVNADLQGCINLALRQQLEEQPAQLNVLSCSNSQVTKLNNIGQLTGLRFLDLGDNSITNITPLENLTLLGGLNLANNFITDISTLINLRSLVSVSLEGNNKIPCSQLRALQNRLKENLTRPTSCEN
jgi:Leucine-rich repeat (LRR) protein